MKAPWLALCFMLMASACSASDPCPAGADDWAAACFQQQAGIRQVRPAHLGKLVVDRSGHAVLRVAETKELVAVDRRGVVVVPGIYHTGDFDYQQARAGLGRFRSGGKCGYFDVGNFEIRIPATFDQCEAFDESATVCTDCVAYCLDGDCHERLMVGGQGYHLDQRNRVLSRFTPPVLAQACQGAPPASVERTPGKAVLRCPSSAAAPFGNMHSQR
jgi:hypothetical protein